MYIRDNAEEDHVDSSLSVLVCCESTGNGEQAGDDVRRNAHELGPLVAVTKTLDDAGEEDGNRVKGSVDADGDEHVNPNLPVLESVPHELALELIRQDRAIIFKSAQNLLLLNRCKELGSVGVVVHCPVGEAG